MKLNGQIINLKKTVSLSELLKQYGYNINRIAVELNGNIIPKSKYSEVYIVENDILEVVTFVGGG